MVPCPSLGTTSQVRMPDISGRTPEGCLASVALPHKSLLAFACLSLRPHFYLPFHLRPQRAEQSSMAQFNIPQILPG